MGTKIFEIIFLIGSIGIILFGLLCLSALFVLDALTATQIVGAIFIGGFFVLVGIGGMWATISYMRS